MLVSLIVRTLYTARPMGVREWMLKWPCQPCATRVNTRKEVRTLSHTKDHMSCNTRETRESSADRQIKRESVQRYNLLPQGGGEGGTY